MGDVPKVQLVQPTRAPTAARSTIKDENTSPSPVNPVNRPVQVTSLPQLLRLQRWVGNRATTDLVTSLRPIQRQGKPPAETKLEDRVAVLEKKDSATKLDLKWRAQFGARLSGYRQVIYALTAGFQRGVTNFQSAHTKQAQEDALKDLVFATIINVGAAGLAEPFLKGSLGFLGGNLKKTVELIENPLLAAEQGMATVGAQAAANARAAGVPSGGIGGSGDPLTFLANNLAEVEKHNGKIEEAFVKRSTDMGSFTAEQWNSWNPAKQEEIYSNLLKDLDKIAMGDPGKLEGSDTLAIKIELYFWAGWIEGHAPGVKGLQIGAKLATRMKEIGMESLANVTFDTSSWIFMSHKPEPAEFENRLHGWARGWSQKLTR